MRCPMRTRGFTVLSSVICLLLAGDARAAQKGVIETPTAQSAQTGIGLISGWHCTAQVIQVQIDGGALRTAGSHTTRQDTAAVCGRADTGFGLLFNYNLLAPGRHRLVAYADGAVFALEDFDTVSLGSEFLVGKQASYPLPNFPQLGQQAIVGWSEEMQNFGIVRVEPAPDVAGTYYGATIRRDCDPDNSILSTQYGAYTVELADGLLTLTIAYADGSSATFKDRPATLGPDGYVSARLGGDTSIGANGQVLTGSSSDTPCASVTIRAAK